MCNGGSYTTQLTYIQHIKSEQQVTTANANVRVLHFLTRDIVEWLAIFQKHPLVIIYGETSADHRRLENNTKYTFLR